MLVGCLGAGPFSGSCRAVLTLGLIIKGAVRAFTVYGYSCDPFLALSRVITARIVAVIGVIITSLRGVSVFLILEALGDSAFSVV